MYTNTFKTNKNRPKADSFEALFYPVIIPELPLYPTVDELIEVERMMVFDINTNTTVEELEWLYKLIKNSHNLKHIFFHISPESHIELFRNLTSDSVRYLTFYISPKEDLSCFKELLTGYKSKYIPSPQGFKADTYLYENFYTNDINELINSVKTPKLERINSICTVRKEYEEDEYSIKRTGKVSLSFFDLENLQYIPFDMSDYMPNQSVKYMFKYYMLSES